MRRTGPDSGFVPSSHSFTLFMLFWVGFFCPTPKLNLPVLPIMDQIESQPVGVIKEEEGTENEVVRDFQLHPCPTPGLVLLNACSRGGLLVCFLGFPHQNGLKALGYLSLQSPGS